MSYSSIQVDGLKIAYREAGDPKNPKLVLRHGFPAGSHQYRDLIRSLAGKFHVIAPDYPKKKRELTAVAIDYVAPTEWFIAGVSVEAQPFSTFHLDIKVTEGTNTKDEKALYLSRVFAAIEQIIGPVEQYAWQSISRCRFQSAPNRCSQ